MSIRRLIRDMCKNLGIEIIRFDNKPGGVNRHPFGEMITVLQDLKSRGLECTAVLDVGANVGNWTKLAASVFPDAKFFMIEPLSEMRLRLEELCRKHPGSRFFLAGAGAESGNLPLTLLGNGNLSASSFIPRSLEPYAPYAEANCRSVPVITIDSLVQRNEMPVPQLAKLDIQGFELEALKGASRLLGATEVFILEVSFFPFMAKERAVFHDVITFMLERDYVCYDFAGFLRRPFDGALAQADAVFVKKNSFLRHKNEW